MTTTLLAAGAILALGGLYALHRRYGMAGLAGGVVAILGLLAAVLRRRPPALPPPGDVPSRATRTAGDILRERHAEEQAAIARAADPANPDRLDDLAARGNARRRRP